MRNLMLNDFYFLFCQLIVGIVILIYLYNRKELPRKSRFIAGCFLIIYAMLSAILVKFAIRDIDIYSSAIILPELKKQDISNALLIAYDILNLVTQFSFAAVGAGLISNALVVRPEPCHQSEQDSKPPSCQTLVFFGLSNRLEQFLGTPDVYKALLKVGFVLIASAVIALGQFGPDFYSKDVEAHKLQFETEFAIKQSINNKTDCSETGQNQASCRLAIHQLKTLESTLGLWESFMQLTFRTGAIIFTLGIIGFLMPLFGVQNKNTPINSQNDLQARRYR
jgi:hypothetical protein